MSGFVAGDTVADPEISDLLIRRRKGETALDHRVREEGRIEIDSETSLLCKLDPLVKVLGLYVVALDLFICYCIYCVKIDALLSGHAGKSKIKVSHKLIGSGSLSGIVTGNLNSSGKSGIALKAVYIIALPAMDRDRNICKLCKSRLGVNAVFGIDLFRLFVSVHNFLPRNFAVM